MLSKDELLKYPNYLLTNYQLEIYGLLKSYMAVNGLNKQKDVAGRLGVSEAYVSQILNGECNFSLKKIIELGLKLGKVPYLEFVSPTDYFQKEAQKQSIYFNAKNSATITVEMSAVPNLKVAWLHSSLGASVPTQHSGSSKGQYATLIKAQHDEAV